MKRRRMNGRVIKKKGEENLRPDHYKWLKKTFEQLF